jgi:hypothetical protein
VEIAKEKKKLVFRYRTEPLDLLIKTLENLEKPTIVDFVDDERLPAFSRKKRARHPYRP